MKTKHKISIVASALCLLASSCHPSIRVKETSHAVNTVEFRKQVEELCETKTIPGNDVKLLRNGKEFLPAMIADIRSAKHSINFETFILREGRVAKAFVTALSERAKQGVKVKVLLDGVGSRFVGEELEGMLENSGAELYYYKEVWKNPIVANNRNHRKLLIIDGSTAYTGGAGVATAWEGNGLTKWNWRDNMYRVKGPVVKEMQQQFTLNWKEVTKENLSGNEYFPPLKSEGSKLVQVSTSGNDVKHHGLAKTFQLAIEAARKDITIANSYVCPPRSIINALIRAKERGVKVTVIGPGQIMDSMVTKRCSHNVLKKFVEKGGDYYEYQPSMYHCKMMIVDGYFNIIGASNLDNRSFFINDENNLHVYDANFAKTQLDDIAKDKKYSEKLSVEDMTPFAWDAWFMRPQL